MQINDYLSKLQKGDTVAVAKGRCDCGLSYAHPQMVIETVKELQGPFIHTYEAGIYSFITGYDLQYDEGDNEYWGIWDPNVSTDAEYLILERRVFELKNYLGIDGFLDTDETTQEEIDECNARLDEIANEVFERGFDRLTE